MGQLHYFVDPTEVCSLLKATAHLHAIPLDALADINSLTLVRRAV